MKLRGKRSSPRSPQATIRMHHIDERLALERPTGNYSCQPDAPLPAILHRGDISSWSGPSTSRKLRSWRIRETGPHDGSSKVWNVGPEKLRSRQCKLRQFLMKLFPVGDSNADFIDDRGRFAGSCRQSMDRAAQGYLYLYFRAVARMIRTRHKFDIDRDPGYPELSELLIQGRIFTSERRPSRNSRM